MDSFSPFLIPFASSMVGLIPVLINLTVNYFDKKSHKAQRDAELNYWFSGICRDMHQIWGGEKGLQSRNE